MIDAKTAQPPAPLLKISDVAKRLSCSISHVTHLIEEGKLTALNMALRPKESRASWRISPLSLERYIKTITPEA